MEIKNKIEIKQEQKLLVTPELSQAIELLEYDNLEMLEYLNKQLELNPLIKLDGSYGEKIYTGDNFNYEEFNMGKEYRNIREYLIRQLNYMDLERDLESICKDLIQYIDEDGYLMIENFNREYNLEYKKTDEAIKVIQKMDPPGVGARSLEESLILQLRSKGKLNTINQKLVLNYLKEIALNEIDLISKAESKIDKKDIRKNINLIKSLEPYPGRKYNLSQKADNYIYPDIRVRKGKSTLNLELIDKYMPKIYLDEYYLDLLENEKDPGVVKYLKDKIRSFLWLKNSIERREETIKKVCKSLVEFQYDFFYNNMENIIPLRYRDIAEDIAMHESTISRVCKDKHIESDLGIYPLTYFFNSRLKSDKGYISSINVKKYILDIIEKEDKSKPLSDQSIVNFLRKLYKVDISRRTVAKYREDMGIGSSYNRKFK